MASIGYAAFYNCAALGAFTLPSSATSVARDAFQGCRGLASVGVNGTLGALGDRAFLGCSALAVITVDAANATYSSANGVLFNKARTTLLLCPAALSGSYTVPSTVTALAAGAFARCNALTSVTLPSSLAAISDDAFYQATALSRVTIPESVTSIGTWALAGCPKLGSVTIPTSVTSVGNDAFHFDGALAYALFSGSAPTMGTTVFNAANSNFTIYYFATQTGFSTPTWLGYPAVALTTPPAVVSWLAQYGYAPGVSTLSDADGDGVSLLLAYALGLNPNANLTGSVPAATLGGNTLSLTFYGNRTDVNYTVQSSADLLTWTTKDVTLTTPDANGLRTASVPADAADGRRFLRLVVGY